MLVSDLDVYPEYGLYQEVESVEELVRAIEELI